MYQFIFMLDSVIDYRITYIVYVGLSLPLGVFFSPSVILKGQVQHHNLGMYTHWTASYTEGKTTPLHFTLSDRKRSHNSVNSLSLIIWPILKGVDVVREAILYAIIGQHMYVIGIIYGELEIQVHHNIWVWITLKGECKIDLIFRHT